MAIAPVVTTDSNTTPGSVYPATAKLLYTKSADDTGWLVVKLEPGGERVAICDFTKIAITKEDSRIHFLILEGRYKKRSASLSKENKARCLVEAKRGPGAMLTAKILGRKQEVSVPRGDGRPLNQLFATLSFDAKSARITLDSDVDFIESNPLSPFKGRRIHSKPLPKGTYKILAPESAQRSDFTAFYATNPGGYPGLKYHTVWFPVEYAGNYNSSFVHVGNLSEGCVTMYQLEMWNPLYLYLISNRLDQDGKYVGTITIE